MAGAYPHIPRSPIANWIYKVRWWLTASRQEKFERGPPSCWVTTHGDARCVRCSRVIDADEIEAYRVVPACTKCLPEIQATVNEVRAALGQPVGG